MEHVSRSMDFPVPVVHMGMVPNMSSYHEQQDFSMPMDQMSFVGSMHYDSEFNRQIIGDAPMLASVTVQDELLPVERKAEMRHALDSSFSQQAQLPNEHTVNLRADSGPLGSVQSSEAQRKTGPMQQNLGSPGSQAQSALSKRKVQTESNGKSGLQRGRPSKKQTVKVDSATKPQSESSDAVRSKMRESLAAALALASQKPVNASTPKKDESEHTITHQVKDGNVSHSASKELIPSQGSVLGSTTSDCGVLSQEISSKGSNFSSGQSFEGFQFNSILPEGDVQFSDDVFAKDDLLQGNGLSWASHADAQMEEGKGAENADKLPSSQEGANFYDHEAKAENLAFEIEAELFKLFGGINKKYREKGRSLLFNLKDQKNPELRERVMSGEISPGRLCSMSAEELASKELSEWRIAKAEELAQMVVLPDTEVNMRRLVKKTHKGEYQVEYEHDDGIIDEVSGGSSMNVQRLPRKNTENHPPNPSTKDGENVTGQKITTENQEFSGSMIIPTDGTDLMQGMMVDEFKDTTSLPPIVSLDEFMESLNSEPPFENLSEDAAQNTPLTHEVSPKVVSKTQTSGRASVSPRDAPPSRRADFGKKHQADMSLKSSVLEKKVLPSSALEVESIWEGIFQLNVTSSVAVRGLFHSGEKTSTKDWSPSLEIKGRVRLDAFEKFLQELPKSRTRALMIIQFVLKDESSENQVSGFSEAFDSDERPGLAEPAAGVELYLCPPTPRIAKLLNRHMSKEGRKTDSSMGNGLIGVVVWRRAHIISPNASSHHKHSSKKQPFSPSNRLQDSSNVVNVNSSGAARASAPVFNNTSCLKPEPEPEEDDDIPPGFGPAAVKDEDDLPEFNFVAGFNSSMTSVTSQKTTPPSVDHVRELIKKYGQSDVDSTTRVESRGLSVQPWDDDDDIPEWQPDGPVHPVARGGGSLLVNRPPWREPVSGGRFPPHRNMRGGRWRQ